MMGAPIGVFALMSALMVEIPDFSTLNALLVYALTVILGLYTFLIVHHQLLKYMVKLKMMILL
jgi:Na+/H+-dicarboxylate symporter